MAPARELNLPYLSALLQQDPALTFGLPPGHWERPCRTVQMRPFSWRSRRTRVTGQGGPPAPASAASSSSLGSGTFGPSEPSQVRSSPQACPSAEPPVAMWLASPPGEASPALDFPLDLASGPVPSPTTDYAWAPSSADRRAPWPSPSPCVRALSPSLQSLLQRLAQGKARAGSTGELAVGAPLADSQLAGQAKRRPSALTAALQAL